MLQNLNISILSERRVFSPYGLFGGEDGEKGLNLLIRKDGKIINLGSKNNLNVKQGDCIIINTPGGGGFGPKEERPKLLE